MKYRLASVLLFALVALSMFGCADRPTTEDDRIRYASGLKKWGPLAEKGDANAQANLALIFIETAPRGPGFSRGMVGEFNETAQLCGMAAGYRRVIDSDAVSPFLIPNYIEAAKIQGASKRQLMVILNSIMTFAGIGESSAQTARNEKEKMFGRKQMEEWGQFCRKFLSKYGKRS